MNIPSSLVLSTLLTASVQLGGAEPSDDDGTAIRGLVKEYSRACEQEDLTALMSLFAKGPDTVKISAVSPRVVTGWESIQEAYRTFFANVENCQMDAEVHSIQILVPGRSACLTAWQAATMEVGNRSVAFKEVRMVWVLENTDGQWRIVNCHWSIPNGLRPGIELDRNQRLRSAQ